MSRIVWMRDTFSELEDGLPGDEIEAESTDVVLVDALPGDEIEADVDVLDMDRFIQELYKNRFVLLLKAQVMIALAQIQINIVMKASL